MPRGTRANGTASIDVCLVTFRRPQVADTLRSIAAQRGLDQVRLRVVVADNDDLPSARETVERCASEFGLEVVYVHAPARNISIGRNACLEHARADWLAFIDDDETASSDWLYALLCEAEAGGWDAVLGPVDAVYPDGAPNWIRRGNFHSIRPVVRRGGIATGYSCNALVRRDAVQGLRFDPAFGRSGGEDLDFFYRFTDRGGSIGFARGAIVLEPAPTERLNFRWLLRRRFRYGQSYGVRLRQVRRTRLARFAAAAFAGLKACVYAAGVILFALSPRLRNRCLFGVALHSGVVARLAGAPLVTVYGEAAPSPT